MLVCLLELRKWGTLINSHKNQNYDVIHEFDSNALPSEGDPFSFTTMVRGMNIHFNREETNEYMGNPHTLREGVLCLYARSLNRAFNIEEIYGAFLLEGQSD